MHAPHLRREIVSSSNRAARAAQSTRAICAHGVAPAAARLAARQPAARLPPLRRSVAHAANDVGVARLLRRRLAAAVKGRERVAFRALRRVVHVFWAHAAELIQPLGGEIDAGRQAEATAK